MTVLNPCVKWAGGKTQIISEIVSRMPQEYNEYYEPFIGGGSVLLSLQPHDAHINDYNEQLVNLYSQIRNNIGLLIESLEQYESVECTKDYYYSMREKFNQKIANRTLDQDAAALFIYLNKHCFNGLYRVNGKGLFNVPWNNNKKGKSSDPDNLRAMSEYLKNVDIHCSDFEVFCKSVQSGDFVYFDSPYIPESTTADFTSYTAGGFTYDDHVRLSKLFKELSDKGAKLMLSNNDVELVHELYADFKIDTFPVKRMINRNADKRTGREVIITNY